jgi:tetratricopeptide (TPR) repeat protein
LKYLVRPFSIVILTALATIVASGTSFGASKPAASPGASASSTPLPLPTATPESAEIVIPRLEAKLKANPNDKEALDQLASYYLGTGRPDKALPLTQRLLSLGEKNAQVYYLDGAANQGVNRIKEALVDYEQAANLEPTNAQILLTLTNLYMQLNRPQDAERVAKRATVFNKDDKQSWENFGLVLSQEKKYDEARQAFEAAAKLDPKDATPIVFEARSYIDQNAIALALQLFDRALSIDPKSTDALLGRARLLAANHDVKGSIAAYDTLMQLVPDDAAKAAVLIEEYRVYSNEKLASDAETTVKHAVETYPNVPAVHLAYGDFLESEKKDDAGAAAQWTTALGDKRDNPEALQRLGSLALKQNKLPDALSDYYRLAQLQPNEPNVYASIGQLEALSKHYDKARDAYRRAFELTHAPAPLAGVGVADYELKNYKECGQIFDALDKSAASFLKQTPELYLVMGKCYAGLGQKDKARGAYTRVLAYLKPGSSQHRDIQKMISDLNARPKASSKPSPKPTSTPH